MKRKYLFPVLTVLLAFGSCSFTSKTFDNPDRDKMLIQIITYVLEEGHFDARDLNDDFSQEVFENYLENLDPNKRYFYRSDVREFEKFKYDIDDQLKSVDISFFNQVNDRLMQRIEESRSLYKEILGQPFDFTKNEEFNTDYEELEYVKNKKQLRERWRKQLKYLSLLNYSELIEIQEIELENETPIDQLNNGKGVMTNQEFEVEARKQTLKSLDEYFDILDDLEREDWFTVFINAVVEEFDPHTFYFAPEDKDRFDISMSGSFEGIGARLQKKMDFIHVTEIISGGPAWKENQLEVGDIILKVKQEDEKTALSIVGMRLDNAIKFIKGPKGTQVTLTVKKNDGTIKEITITRDVVELEETYAKSAYVEKGNKTFGLISLPRFYVDFTDYKKRNAASDLKQEIERLKRQGIEGLVIDLRNNGGGSLQTVVEIVGLFIEKGPVVQVKSSLNPKQVLEDRDRSITWDGPLVILVNELSASASEILAAAMQDYNRAIIIGSEQTYGKGTVQNMVNLNNWVRNNKNGDIGALKLTTQKFYRIDGGSTQLEGVKSDVVVPDIYSYVEFGEKNQKNPLPWDKISAVDYEKWDTYYDYNETIQKSKERMAKNDQLNLIEENAKWVKKNRAIQKYTLNYQSHKTQVEQLEKEAKKFDKIMDYKTNLSFESLPYEKRLFEKDSTLFEKRKRWHEDLSSDVYIEEALNVLNDLKMTHPIDKVASLKDWRWSP